MSETTNLKLFKHDEPLESNENQFDIDKALNENWDKVDNTYGDLEVKNSEQDSEIQVLKNALPTETSEAENINIKGTIPTKFKEFVVGGNSKQKTRSGKNLFNKADEPVIKNSNIKLEQTETGIKATMIEEGAFDYIIYKLKDVSDYIGKTVRLKTNITYEDTNTTNSNSRIGIGLADENVYSSSRKTFAALTESGEISFTINEKDITTMPYLAVWIYPRISSDSTTGKATTTFDDLIVTVDNEDMTYEPYGAMPSPEFPSEIQNVEGNVNVTVCNKNLFTGFVKGKGLFSSTGEEKVDDKSGTSNFIQVNFDKNESYCISGLADTISSFVAFYNKNKDYLGRTAGSQKTNMSFNSNSYSSMAQNYESIKDKNIRFIRVTQYEVDNSIGTIDDIDNLQVQLETGSTTTDYVEHQEQTVTFPLAQGQKLMLGDYLASDGIHHVRKQVELDGTENITVYNRNYTTGYAYRIPISGGVKPNSNLLCTKYKSIPFVEFYNTDTNIVEKCATHDTGSTYVYFGSSKSTLEEFKQEILGTTVEYELTEEEIETYTPEQQEAYNQLKQLTAYEEETNIYSTNSTSPIFKVTAVKDINSVITQLNQVLLERS